VIRPRISIFRRVPFLSFEIPYGAAHLLPDENVKSLKSTTIYEAAAGGFETKRRIRPPEQLSRYARLSFSCVSGNVFTSAVCNDMNYETKRK
jgi:hypothetical protein